MSSKDKKSTGQQQSLPAILTPDQLTVGLTPVEQKPSLTTADKLPTPLRRSFVPVQGSSPETWPCSFALDSEGGKAKLFAALSPADAQIGEGGEILFTATDYLIIPDERTDEETGELKQFATVVFFDRHGQTFKTSGVMMPDRVRILAMLYPRERWLAGITLVIRERKSKREKRMYHDIRVIVDA